MTNEKLLKIADDMVNPKETCKMCKFVVCPALTIFSRQIKEAIGSAPAGNSQDDTTILTALRKIREATADYEKDFNKLGYIYRTANNALLELEVQ